MAACGGNFQGALDVFLSAHIRKIYVIGIGILEKFVAGFEEDRFQGALTIEELYGFKQVGDSIDLQFIHNSGFAGVLCGQDEAFVFFFAGLDGHRQSPFDGMQRSVEGQFAHEHELP